MVTNNVLVTDSHTVERNLIAEIAARWKCLYANNIGISAQKAQGRQCSYAVDAGLERSVPHKVCRANGNGWAGVIVRPLLPELSVQEEIIDLHHADKQQTVRSA